MSYIGTTINESPVVALSAAAEIKGFDFLAVELTDTGIQLPAKKGAAIIGIVIPGQDDIAAGDTVTVQVSSMGKWTSGEAVSAGALLTADTTGKCVAASSGEFIAAMALEAATGADVPIKVQITKSGYAQTASNGN